MIQVITQAIDSGDGVFIGGKHLHYNFKPMTNNELTLDQLTAISGGGKAEREARRADRQNKRTERKGPDAHADKVFKFGPFCIDWGHPEDCPYGDNSTTSTTDPCVPVENQ